MDLVGIAGRTGKSADHMKIDYRGCELVEVERCTEVWMKAKDAAIDMPINSACGVVVTSSVSRSRLVSHRCS